MMGTRVKETTRT